MSERSLLSDFVTYIGDDFQVNNLKGVTLQLFSGDALKNGFSQEVVEPKDATNFSLIFHGPPNVALNQGMYDLEHPQLKTKSIFLVPVGLKDGCTELEAVFTTVPQSVATQ